LRLIGLWLRQRLLVVEPRAETDARRDPAVRDRKATRLLASVFVVVSLASRVLFDRIKFAMEFGNRKFLLMPMSAKSHNRK